MTAEPHLPDKLPGKAATTPFRRPLILSAIFAVLSTLLLADLAPRFAPGLLRFEHYMGDVRTAFLSDQLPSQHPQVAIVAITDDTLAGYKTFLPVDRHLLARLVDAVDAAGAKVIGLDFLFAASAAGRQRAAADRRHPARQGQDRAGGGRRARRPHAGPARQAAGLLARGRPSGGLLQPGHGARFGRPLHGPALRRRHAGLPQELCRAAGRKRRLSARRMAAAHCLAAHAARRLRRVPHRRRRDAAAARRRSPGQDRCATASRTRSCSWAAPCARSTRT